MDGQDGEGVSAFTLSVFECCDQHYSFKEDGRAFIYCELELVVVFGCAQNPVFGNS